MAVQVKFTGWKEVEECFKQMPLQLTDKVLQDAGVSSSKVLVERAKNTAPEGPTGNLIDSIGAIRGNFKQVISGKRELGVVAVGPRRGGKFKGGHGHLVEYGTVERFQKPKYSFAQKKSVGVMPVNPFMEPAFEATKTELLSKYNEEVGRKLFLVMRRTLKT